MTPPEDSPRELRDEDLPALHARGDPRAFEALVRRHATALLDLAERLTGDRAEALDLRQTALVNAHRALAAFDGRARLSTWLARLVVNAARDAARRGRVRADAQLAAARGNGRAVEHASPDVLAARDEAGARVARAVAALPAEEREVVVLRHWHGLTFADVAAVVGAPVTTVKSRAARALERLRVCLKELQPHG